MRHLLALAVLLSASSCDGIWKISGALEVRPLSGATPFSCKEVRRGHKELSKIFDQFNSKLNELLDAADEETSKESAERAVELSKEIHELRVKAEKLSPGKFSTRDRLLLYRWSVDLKKLAEPFPHAKRPWNLRILSAKILSATPKIGLWPAEIPFQVEVSDDHTVIAATASREANALESCMDAERTLIDVEVELSTNFYGVEVMKLRLKGDRE